MSAENNALFFLDTNILVYASDASAGSKQEIARELVQRGWQEENGCLSVQVLQEFYVTVTQKIKTPLTPEFARQLVADFSYWKVHTPIANDVLEAISLQQDLRLAFWDAMILQSSLRVGAKLLYSEDLSHGKTYAGVVITNPFIG